MGKITYEVVKWYLDGRQAIIVRDARGPRPVWRPGWRTAGGRFQLPRNGRAPSGYLVGSLDYVLAPPWATPAYRTRKAALARWADDPHYTAEAEE